MQLRRQLLLLLYLAAVSAVAAGTLAVYFLVMPVFFDLEEATARSQVKRVEASFIQTLTTLNARARDFAERDMVRLYAQESAGAVVPSAPGQSLGSPPLDLVSLVTEAGEQLWLADVAGEDRASLSALYQVFRERACYSFWGVTRFSGEAHIFAIEQTADCGAVVLGMRLDESMAAELSGITGFEVALVDSVPDWEKGVEVQRLDSGSVLGSFAIRDFNGLPVMRGDVLLERPAYSKGINLMLTVAAALLLVALLAVSLVHGRFRYLVFERLGRLHDTVRLIAHGNDLDARVHVPGDDELAQLAQDFNLMVENIREAQRSLAGASEKAESASRAKSLFLANMSHEIRTPMTAILGYAELLENRYITDEERQRYLTIIQQNGDALMALISDVLDLSRIEAGQLSVELQRFDLPALLNDVILSHTLRAQQKGIALSLDYRTPVPREITTDPFRLRQILVNLVSNAVKFTEDGGVTVHVSWQEGADEPLDIEVADTGIGIPEEGLDHVFEPFSQVDSSHTRRFGGSGLGLAIGWQLARSLGGELSVHSEVGAGSTFTLLLRAAAAGGERLRPVDVAQPRQVADEPAAPAETSVGGRVLLVEDNRVNRLLVQRILSQGQMDVIESENGQQALDRFDAGEHFDLVVMDMQMPVLDGYETARALRERGYTGPILALTANVMSEDKGRCLAAGCDEFLGKPVRAKQLLGTCARLLKTQ